jgi:hypothetical protein
MIFSFKKKKKKKKRKEKRFAIVISYNLELIKDDKILMITKILNLSVKM